MIAMMEAPAPSVLRPHAHGVMLEMAAHQIWLMIPTLKALCAPSPAAVWGNGVPFGTFNEGARFVITHGGSDKTLNATAVQIRRAAKIGAVAYGIRWKANPKQANGPIMSCKRGRPPKDGGKPRSRAIAVRRLENGQTYNQILDAAREFAPYSKCNVKTAFMRISRAVRYGKPAFGSRWQLERDFQQLIPEWASA